MKKKHLKGNIIRIERSSIHDGQGLRTVIFLKGCQLSCPWCSTPESQSFEFEKGYDQRLCTACGRCIESCPENAITLSDDGLGVITDRDKCVGCFRCFEVCQANAVKKYGFTMTVDDLMKEISKDEIFYFHSGGGITLSGGEPLCQPDFCAALLEKCKINGIHTALESSLYTPYSSLDTVLPWLDHLYADLKHMDNQMHTLWVGASNQTTLDNLIKADQTSYHFGEIIRIPLIPGYNDTDSNLAATLGFCTKLKKIKEIELLPYHRLGSDTYRLLGLDYRCRDLLPPSEEHVKERAEFMNSLLTGIPIRSGSEIT
ncbi:MAG: glycyl-radical enzyme activating protein [Firmicutes bacterium]|nr:glycyl-radical enzyme activating protein [Bacillota bacterium]